MTEKTQRWKLKKIVNFSFLAWREGLNSRFDKNGDVGKATTLWIMMGHGISILHVCNLV